MADRDIPVIVFHEGCPKHLPYSLKSTERHNKRVILLGNEDNRHVAREWFDVRRLNLSRYEEFKKVFVNYSAYTEFFALINFKRYFLYYELMKELGFDRILVAESDLYTCADYSDIPSLNDAYAMVSTSAGQEENYGWSSCCHCSYWTIAALDDFLNFCYKTYRDNKELLLTKWDYHKKNGLAGGICDMTLVYLWSKDKQGIINSTHIFDGKTIDQNLCDEVNYEKGEYKYSKLFKIKKYVIKKDDKGVKLPYLVRADGKLVGVYSIHCSGRAKAAISKFDKSYVAVCMSQAAALMKMRLGRIKAKVLRG